KNHVLLVEVLHVVGNHLGKVGGADRVPIVVRLFKNFHQCAGFGRERRRRHERAIRGRLERRRDGSCFCCRLDGRSGGGNRERKAKEAAENSQESAAERGNLLHDDVRRCEGAIVSPTGLNKPGKWILRRRASTT